MVKSLVWGAAAALLLATSPAWAAMKIGYVNFPELLQKSPQAKATLSRLRAEFIPRQRKLKQLQASLKARASRFQRDAATMTSDERQQTQDDLTNRGRDLQLRAQELQQDFDQQRDRAVQSLEQTLAAKVATYARARNYDLVLMDGVIYAKGGIDITPQILALLGVGSKPAAGASSRTRARK